MNIQHADWNVGDYFTFTWESGTRKVVVRGKIVSIDRRSGVINQREDSKGNQYHCRLSLSRCTHPCKTCHGEIYIDAKDGRVVVCGSCEEGKALHQEMRR